MDDRRAIQAVIVLTALAALLRFIALDSGLWYDEIVTLVEFARVPIGTLLTTFPTNNNHPLYSVLAHATMAGLGEHAWTLRLPAVMFGVMTIPLVYAVGRIVTTTREALLAPALLAVSYHHVWFSQNARGYSALVLWTMATTWLLWLSVRRKHLRFYVGYGVLAAVGLYTHLTFAAVVVTHAVAWMWIRIRPADAGVAESDLRRALLALGLTGAIALALYAPLVPEMHEFFAKTPPIGGARIANPRWAVGEMLRGLRFGLGTVGPAVAALLAMAGFLSYLRQNRLIAVVFCLPGILMAAAPLLLGRPTFPRFFLFLIGFAVLVIIRGATVSGGLIASLWRRSGSDHAARVRMANLVSAALILASAATVRAVYQFPKQDFASAMHFVETRAASADIATVGLATLPYQRYYRRSWAGLDSVEDLRRFQSTRGRVWILHTFPAYIDADLRAALDRECVPAATFHGTVGGGDIIVCSIDTSQPPLHDR